MFSSAHDSGRVRQQGGRGRRLTWGQAGQCRTGGRVAQLSQTELQQGPKPWILRLLPRPPLLAPPMPSPARTTRLSLLCHALALLTSIALIVASNSRAVFRDSSCFRLSDCSLTEREEDIEFLMDSSEGHPATPASSNCQLQHLACTNAAWLALFANIGFAGT